MNESGKNRPGQASGDALARLLEIAEPRPEPPAAMAEAVRKAAYEEWQRKTRGRAVRRRGAWVAMAATLLLVVGGLVTLLPGQGPVAQATVAGIDRSAGRVEISLAEKAGTWQRLAGDARRLEQGVTVRTGKDGRLGLITDDGYSLRLDHDTSLLMAGSDEVRLLSGRIYIDTGEEVGEGPGIRVVTAHGVVYDIGTQFEVQSNADAAQVRVREGRIRLIADHNSHDAAAGEQLQVDAAGAATRAAIAPYSPEWRWVEALAPNFDPDGRPLLAFLHWASRETGTQLRFADAAAEDAARTLIIRGSIPGLAPSVALGAVMDTTALRYELHDGLIVVHRQGAR